MSFLQPACVRLRSSSRILQVSMP